MMSDEYTQSSIILVIKILSKILWNLSSDCIMIL